LKTFLQFLALRYDPSNRGTVDLSRLPSTEQLKSELQRPMAAFDGRTFDCEDPLFSINNAIHLGGIHSTFLELVVSMNGDKNKIENRATAYLCCLYQLCGLIISEISDIKPEEESRLKPTNFDTETIRNWIFNFYARCS